jgi:hypothetical protein
VYPLYRLIKKTWIFNYVRRAIYPRIVYKKNFSIGMLVGVSYNKLGYSENIINPILTAKDVVDVAAVFVADPFLIQEGPAWYMFFEVLNAKSRKGEIGLAKSNDGFNWKYDQIVLSEPFHLSYPYIFEWENEYYMIPESEDADAIRLYKADKFPKGWSHISTLIKGKYVDSSIFYHKGKWWIFTAKGDDSLYLFFADNLLGPWRQHPKNPIINGDPHIARPAGRVLVVDGKVLRFAQDDYPKYGLKVHAFEVTELSTEVYQEKMMVDSLLGPSGIGWNARGMHHICPQQVIEGRWLACVDGWSQSVKAYTK